MTTSILRAAAAVCLSASAFAQAQQVQTFPLRDSNGLILRDVKAEAVEFAGRQAIRLKVEGPSNGIALLPGTDFQDGVIEADVALKVTAPKGVRNPGFIGIAFRARPDAKHYELFYIRPGNSVAEDQAMRNHAVQYCAEPGFSWYRLRREWPWVYESHADFEPETWTKVRIEVAGRGAKLYLNGSTKPSLVIDGLKGEDLHGAVALWPSPDQESYFSNVTITPAAPLPVKNGSDAAGAWEVHGTSDMGPLDGSLKLDRSGDKLTGTWSGVLGTERTVTGTWRDGYVELSFPGEWPKDGRQGAPGPVTAFMAGWIDGNSGKGRMRVEGRADGQWMATRKEQ